MGMIIDLIGYVGMVSLLLGIYVVRREGWAFRSDILLIIGQSGLVINCLYYHAYPAVIANAILVVITAKNIRKDLKKE